MTERDIPHAVAPPAGAQARDNPWLGLDRGAKFFENGEIRDLLDRAVFYARSGVCVHFNGMAGFGKTTLALRAAEALGRPVSFMAGNDWLTSHDFIGREVGQTTSTVVDKYVQSVRRTESETRSDWKDAILALSMERGYTLVYDEFTRASPEANSTLLSVLEEGVLVSTDPANGRTYLRAHPDFRMIVTSNPHDYAGVNGAPDALLDRMVTLTLHEPTEATLAGIAAARSGLDRAHCDRIVALVRRLRAGGDSAYLSSMRTVILIARIAALMVRERGLDDAALAQIVTDVLAGRGMPIARHQIEAALEQDRAA